MSGTKGRLDWMMRMPAEVEDAYERAHGADRVTHLRRSILIGLIVYNIYNLTSLFLMADIQPTTVALRLGLLTPGSLLLFWAIRRVNAQWRERLLFVGMLVAALLPPYLLWLSNSVYASYTLGEFPLVLLFGNMLLVLRFRYALMLTTTTCIAALLVVYTKQTIEPALLFPLTVQLVSGLFFTLYGNWHAERQRARGFLAQYDAENRAEEAEREGVALRDISRTDMLTGIPNRRHLDEHLPGLFKDGEDHVLLMVDVDYFKAYNDACGHQEGDACLKRIAAALADFADRHQGFAARYGGEEFTLILPGDVKTGGAFLADRLVRRIRALSIAHPARPDGLSRITVSIGYAGTDETREMTALIEKADRALYEAKRAGRGLAKAG
ncbi:GGDEF domain-containing protein [Peteryoungia ipomoeae]|uniref:diguanylate cyclase n=1 Tax=Peteryoungia ipomoeae TaxID=1210932 RepID=A0A4S8P102_9HYPH|nr:GGDEF domain-containing protein [Peteryoungia ipomoeae]THV22905.1 GGDEF domain-containing protein [Peteryoungia ipomoeae]